MLGDLFDSPWKILIIAAVVLILFGSRKMPEAARSLGRSMRILKTEIKDMHEEDAAGGAQDSQQPQAQPAPPQQLAAPVAAPAPGVQYTAPAAAAPAAGVPVPEVQQDTRPA